MSDNKKESVEIRKAEQVRGLSQQQYCIGTELCNQLYGMGVTALSLWDFDRLLKSFPVCKLG